MSRDNRGTGNMMRYAGLATQWMVMLLATFWIGWELDKKTGLSPLFLILLPLLALGFSLWQLIREFNKPVK